MNINIKLFSKNKDSLATFLGFLIKILKNKKLQLNYFLKFFNKKTQKSIITTLKSPHVNKSSQEQFGYTVNIKLLKIKSIKINKLLIVIKKLKNSFLSDVHIKITFDIKKNKTIFMNKFFNIKKYKKGIKNTKINVTMLNIYLLNIYGKVNKGRV